MYFVVIQCFNKNLDELVMIIVNDIKFSYHIDGKSSSVSLAV